MGEHMKCVKLPWLKQLLKTKLYSRYGKEIYLAAKAGT